MNDDLINKQNKQFKVQDKRIDLLNESPLILAGKRN